MTPKVEEWKEAEHTQVRSEERRLGREGCGNMKAEWKPGGCRSKERGLSQEGCDCRKANRKLGGCMSKERGYGNGHYLAVGSDWKTTQAVAGRIRPASSTEGG